jgi:hypothetical protein
MELVLEVFRVVIPAQTTLTVVHVRMDISVRVRDVEDVQ